MTIPLIQIALGFVIACTISMLAWHFRMLSSGGALSAALLGTVVFGCGGLVWAITLIAFFLSSSLLSRFRKGCKTNLIEKFSKGSSRDTGQVLANGGIAGIFALLNLFFPSSPILWLGYAGSIAAVNADTWATELGVLVKQPPRLITTWKKVEKGESGAITAPGTLAALLGSMFIALFACCASILLQDGSITKPSLFLISITIGGFSGSMLDSLLGASLQASFFCPVCKKRTERSPFHTCGSQTTLVSGQIWLNNDLVNIFCSAAGAALAILIWNLPA